MMLSDPAYEEDRRQLEWDKFAENLPICTLCRRRLYPGVKFHTARYQIVCTRCKEELDESEDVVEIES